MRALCSVVLVAALAGSAISQEKPQPVRPPMPEPTLKVGDAAPALKATKWLQGDEVTEFAKGQVYVVEFWTTWCGPCIVMMPHMSELQAQFKGKATIIGFSAQDPNNSAEKVAAFVKKRGPKLGYTFAFAEDRDTYNNWMKAAGRNGIPCCFVVGKDGNLAYIGHPMYLDVVLPKVVAGTWKTTDADELTKVEAEVSALFKAVSAPDAEAGLKAIGEFEAKYPALAHIPYFTGPKITMMIKAKKFDEAKKFAQDLIAVAVKNDDSSALRSVSSALRSPAAADQKELLALSLAAAESGLKVDGDKDPISLYYVAEALLANGDKERASAFAKKAVEAADTAQLKTTLERMTKKFEDVKKID